MWQNPYLYDIITLQCSVEQFGTKEEYMSTLREPKPGENVFFYCPDCGNRFSDIKPLLPLIPVKCPKCGKSRCREDLTVRW